MTQNFQKLNIDLPRQPLSEQRVWMIAGWLLAVAVVIVTIISYVSYASKVQAEVIQTEVGIDTTRY
jgi:hypothetical protein